MRPACHTREPAMSKRHLLSPSIQKTLFIWVLPTMVVGMVLSLLLSVALLEEQAETAFDRTLAGVLQAIEANISTAHGGLALEEPFRLLEFFKLTATGNVYYHVAKSGRAPCRERERSGRGR